MTSVVQRAALVLTFAGALHAQTSEAPGRAVFQRMHDAYTGKWYSTLRFVQKTTQYRPDGTKIVATWYESLRQVPGGRTELRIDIGDLANGNGVLYTADSSWVARGGKIGAARANGNEFLPLIEGVYLQPVDVTLRQLAPTHVDMSRVAQGSWEGRAATIIGVASPADSTAPQIWVDDERNVVVRVILSPSAGLQVMDIHLDDYVKTGEGWLATKVAMSVGGKPLQVEDYADWKTGMDLPADLFMTSAWTPKVHWAAR